MHIMKRRKSFSLFIEMCSLVIIVQFWLPFAGTARLFAIIFTAPCQMVAPIFFNGWVRTVSTCALSFVYAFAHVGD